MVDVRDDRWALIDPSRPEAAIATIREILRDQEERLSALDVNGDGLVVPSGYVTQTMLADDSVGSAQIIADAVGASEIAPLAVDTAEIADSAVTTAKLGPAAVTKAKLAGSFLGATCIAGGAAGNHTVTGIATADQLVLVARLDRDAVAANIDLTAITGEFTISAANTINNAAGTDTTGDALLVLYLDLT